MLSRESSKITDKALQATLQQFLLKAMNTITWFVVTQQLYFKKFHGVDKKNMIKYNIIDCGKSI